MEAALCYPLDRARLGSAVIINNLHTEQTPTRRDVDSLSRVFKAMGIVDLEVCILHICCLGFDVEVYTDMSGKDMNDLKRRFTDEKKHTDSNCFLLLIIR